MTENRGWLVDKSALVRLGASADASLWAERVGRGVVRIATVTLLEVGCSARTGPDWASLLNGPPITSMPVELMTPKAEARAVEVQGVLAASGRHRAPSIPDLLVAAVAEAAGLAVLHLDKDFELVAEVTRQPMERLRA